MVFSQFPQTSPIPSAALALFGCRALREGQLHDQTGGTSTGGQEQSHCWVVGRILQSLLTSLLITGCYMGSPYVSDDGREVFCSIQSAGAGDGGDRRGSVSRL